MSHICQGTAVYRSSTNQQNELQKFNPTRPGIFLEQNTLLLLCLQILAQLMVLWTPNFYQSSTINNGPTCVFWQLNAEDLAGDKMIQNATESAELNRNRMQTNHQFCCRSNYQLCSADYQLCFLNRCFRSNIHTKNTWEAKLFCILK